MQGPEDLLPADATDVVYMDLVQDVLTHGWTDDQIRGKTRAELASMVRSRFAVVTRLLEHVATAEADVEVAKDILKRWDVLNGQ